MRPALPALLTLLLTGCFGYVDAGETPLDRGARVRAHLAAPMDVRLTHLSANDVERVEGELISLTPDTLVVSALHLRSAQGFATLGAGESVRVPRSDLVRIERHRISWIRSAGLAAALFAGMALIDRIAGGSGGEEGETPGGGGATQ